jgi:hypothetical protein
LSIETGLSVIQFLQNLFPDWADSLVKSLQLPHDHTSAAQCSAVLSAESTQASFLHDDATVSALDMYRRVVKTPSASAIWDTLM